LIRFARHESNYLIFFGILYIMAAITKDVVLSWSLAFGRFIMGTLNLYSVVGDHACGYPFLSFAIPEILTSVLVASVLPHIDHALLNRCNLINFKLPHFLLASLSIIPALAHFSGLCSINQSLGRLTNMMGLGDLPTLQNTECVRTVPPPARWPGPRTVLLALTQVAAARTDPPRAGGIASWPT
jgi:hypothetical protein